MNRFAYTAVLLALASTAFAEDKAAEPIRKILTAQSDAWNKGDLDGFLETYWKSEDLVFFSGGTISKGHKAVADRYAKRYKAEGKEMGKLEFIGLEVEMLGKDTAFARGKWKLEMKAEKPEGLFTLILKKTSDGWKIVHDHTSVPEPKKEPEKK